MDTIAHNSSVNIENSTRTSPAYHSQLSSTQNSPYSSQYPSQSNSFSGQKVWISPEFEEKAELYAWILSSHDATVVSSPNGPKVFHLLRKFEGSIFEELCNNGRRIIGLACLAQSIKLKLPLPAILQSTGKRIDPKDDVNICSQNASTSNNDGNMPIKYLPVFSRSLENCKIVVSNLNHAYRHNIRSMTILSCGEYSEQFDDRTTHLLTKRVGSLKYFEASKLNMLRHLRQHCHDQNAGNDENFLEDLESMRQVMVVKPKWLKESFKRTKRIDLPRSGAIAEEYSVPCLTGLTICSSGFLEPDRTELKQQSEALGATFSPSLNQNCSLLVVNTDPALRADLPPKKITFAIHYNIPLISLQWFTFCCKKNCLVLFEDESDPVSSLFDRDIQDYINYLKNLVSNDAGENIIDQTNNGQPTENQNGYQENSKLDLPEKPSSVQNEHRIRSTPFNFYHPNSDSSSASLTSETKEKLGHASLSSHLDVPPLHQYEKVASIPMTSLDDSDDNICVDPESLQHESGTVNTAGAVDEQQSDAEDDNQFESSSTLHSQEWDSNREEEEDEGEVDFTKSDRTSVIHELGGILEFLSGDQRVNSNVGKYGPNSNESPPNDQAKHSGNMHPSMHHQHFTLTPIDVPIVSQWSTQMNEDHAISIGHPPPVSPPPQKMDISKFSEPHLDIPRPHVTPTNSHPVRYAKQFLEGLKILVIGLKEEFGFYASEFELQPPFAISKSSITTVPSEEDAFVPSLEYIELKKMLQEASMAGAYVEVQSWRYAADQQAQVQQQHQFLKVKANESPISTTIHQHHPSPSSLSLISSSNPLLDFDTVVIYDIKTVTSLQVGLIKATLMKTATQLQYCSRKGVSNHKTDSSISDTFMVLPPSPDTNVSPPVKEKLPDIVSMEWLQDCVLLDLLQDVESYRWKLMTLHSPISSPTETNGGTHSNHSISNGLQHPTSPKLLPAHGYFHEHHSYSEAHYLLPFPLQPTTPAFFTSSCLLDPSSTSIVAAETPADNNANINSASITRPISLSNQHTGAIPKDQLNINGIRPLDADKEVPVVLMEEEKPSVPFIFTKPTSTSKADPHKVSSSLQTLNNYGRIDLMQQDWRGKFQKQPPSCRPASSRPSKTSAVLSPSSVVFEKLQLPLVTNKSATRALIRSAHMLSHLRQTAHQTHALPLFSPSSTPSNNDNQLSRASLNRNDTIIISTSSSLIDDYSNIKDHPPMPRRHHTRHHHDPKHVDDHHTKSSTSKSKDGRHKKKRKEKTSPGKQETQKKDSHLVELRSKGTERSHDDDWMRNLEISRIKRSKRSNTKVQKQAGEEVQHNRIIPDPRQTIGAKTEKRDHKTAIQENENNAYFRFHHGPVVHAPISPITHSHLFGDEGTELPPVDPQNNRLELSLQPSFSDQGNPPLSGSLPNSPSLIFESQQASPSVQVHKSRIDSSCALNHSSVRDHPNSERIDEIMKVNILQVEPTQGSKSGGESVIVTLNKIDPTMKVVFGQVIAESISHPTLTKIWATSPPSAVSLKVQLSILDERGRRINSDDPPAYFVYV